MVRLQEKTILPLVKFLKLMKFSILETSAATIIKNEEKLHKAYASNRKQISHGKFHKLNEAMYL